MVEHVPEEHGVGGSSPPLGTRIKKQGPTFSVKGRILFFYFAEGESQLLGFRADLKDGAISLATGESWSRVLSPRSLALARRADLVTRDLVATRHLLTKMTMLL